MRLSPHPPHAYLGYLASTYFSLGRYEEAADLLEKVLATNPTAQGFRMRLVATYAKLKRIEDAEWEAEEILAADPNFSVKRISKVLPYKDPVRTAAGPYIVCKLGTRCAPKVQIELALDLVKYITRDPYIHQVRTMPPSGLVASADYLVPQRVPSSPQCPQTELWLTHDPMALLVWSLLKISQSHLQSYQDSLQSKGYDPSRLFQIISRWELI